MRRQMIGRQLLAGCMLLSACNPGGEVAAPPEPAEVCNNIDDDGDGQIDELAVDAIRVTRDADGDGFGMSQRHHDGAIQRHQCPPIPSGWADNADDCDDENGEVSPAGIEVCNGRDDDCDGLFDENLSSCDRQFVGETADFHPCVPPPEDWRAVSGSALFEPWPAPDDAPRLQRLRWATGEWVTGTAGCANDVHEAAAILAGAYPQLLGYSCKGDHVALVEADKSSFLFAVVPDCKVDAEDAQDKLPIRLESGLSTAGRRVPRCGRFARMADGSVGAAGELVLTAENWPRADALEFLHQAAFRDVTGDAVLDIRSVFARHGDGVRACVVRREPGNSSVLFEQHDWTLDEGGRVVKQVAIVAEMSATTADEPDP